MTPEHMDVFMLERREARPVFRGELADGELTVLRREETAFARVVGEDLLFRAGVVEAEALGRLDPDRPRLPARRGEAGRSVGLREVGGVGRAVAVLRGDPGKHRSRVRVCFRRRRWRGRERQQREEKEPQCRKCRFGV